jgi:hypothetical protein
MEKASAEIKVDLLRYNAILLKGGLSHSATFDFSVIMTGAALENTATYFTNEYAIGNRLSGTSKVLSSTVGEISLAAKPPKATVDACIDDQTLFRNRKGVVVDKSDGKASVTLVMLKKDAHWLVSETKSTQPSIGECTKSP